MGFEFYKESYAGSIKEISIGEGSKAVVVGGETCYPFYQFEGNMPNKPKIAMEIWDIKPEDWSEVAIAPFKDVIHDVASWAKKCVDDYNAEIIVLQLKSIDPNGINASSETALSTVKKVLEVIDVPLIVWGIANAEKDEEVFKIIAEYCQDYNLILGPVEDKNHKSIGAAAIGYGHLLISSSPIDVNLAKQVNILLENLGMPMNKVLIDPTTGGLGYGLEYSYSVMERLRMAALTQGDDKLQMPIINNLGNEIWKSKEAKLGFKEAPLLGDPEKRGILMEAVGGVIYLMAGSDILIMRHPESIRLVKSYIELIMNGGTSLDIAPITKKLPEVNINYDSLFQVPDLTLEKITVIDKKNSEATSLGSSSLKKIKLKVNKEDKIKKEVEIKIKSTVKFEKNSKEDFEEPIANIDKKLEKKLILEKAAEKVAAEKEKELKEVNERDLLEEILKNKRLAERSKNLQKLVKCTSSVKITAAVDQKEEYQKIIDKLQWVHRRNSLYKW